MWLVETGGSHAQDWRTGSVVGALRNGMQPGVARWKYEWKALLVIAG